MAMFNTPGKKLGFYKKVPLNGLFQEGVWHCNCLPRLPAAKFIVKKEGPNKGRYFFTCQEPKDKGCGFFLWAEDAAPREMGAVLSNTRSEIAESSDTISTRSGVNKNTVEGHIVASNAFMADQARKDDEVFGKWPLSVEDEAAVFHAAEKVSHPETPRKTVKFSAAATPNSMRSCDEAEGKAWPTPATRRSESSTKDIFSTPSKLKAGGMFDGNERMGLLSPSITPTPNRFANRDGDAASELNDFDITSGILDLLADQCLSPEATSKVKQTLNRYALKMEGIIRGRDITRAALKGKDARIVELQQNITSLETEREMDKVVIRHLKKLMAESDARKAEPGINGTKKGS